MDNPYCVKPLHIIIVPNSLQLYCRGNVMPEGYDIMRSGSRRGNVLCCQTLELYFKGQQDPRHFSEQDARISYPYFAS
ncbi:uncharacterized protein PHALS_08492 [Plasmopara halstedii]|uniref:Uncharacterized protein n=1 Tax=Plasmopara halstedii TaxID=4781 RepID=A0A0P1ACN2_PLAHL|nr:uncharacterized protein PHALS_08492 [Plasmopara halstedii]CEG38414.1 hypothetical protein PHALS_08492 [Plasmopara halstedii]|eukprot:XP_024574783.1 hypothetical protein PHALS_08492 [Plasmopara halstedii]